MVGNIGLISNDPLGTFSATFNPLLGAVSSVSFVYSSFLGMTFVGGGSTLALPTTVDGQGVNHPTLFTFNGVLTGFELQDNAGDTANNPLYDPQNGDSNNLIGEFGSGFSLVDDLSVTSRNTPELLPTGGTVPDASSTLGLLGLAGAGMLALRRKAVVS